jgi:hypothetical protein
MEQELEVTQTNLIAETLVNNLKNADNSEDVVYALSMINDFLQYNNEEINEEINEKSQIKKEN